MIEWLEVMEGVEEVFQIALVVVDNVISHDQREYIELDLEAFQRVEHHKGQLFLMKIRIISINFMFSIMKC